MKKPVVLLLLACLAVGLVLWRVFTPDAESPPPVSEHEMHQPEAASPTTTTTERDVPFEHREAISGFLRAYYSQSYRDPTALTWTDRVASWATKELAGEIADGRSGGGAAWEEFVNTQSEYRVEDVTATALPDASEEAPTYLIEYTWITATSAGATRQEMVKLITLEHELGRWLATSFDAYSTGTSFVAEVAPTDSPDEETFTD